MKIRYKDESAHALRLRLCSGTVDRSQFEILRSATAKAPGIEIRASIIGASHLIEYRVGDEVLTEVLACQSTEQPGLWRPGDGAVELDLRSERTYRFNCQTATLDSAELALAALRQQPARPSPSEFSISFEFPSAQGSDLQAETIVAARFDGPRRSATIRTAHSYPGEGLVVLSQSEVCPALVRTA